MSSGPTPTVEPPLHTYQGVQADRPPGPLPDPQALLAPALPAVPEEPEPGTPVVDPGPREPTYLENPAYFLSTTHCVRYDFITGRLTDFEIVQSPAAIAMQRRQGWHVALGKGHADTHYVLVHSETLVERPVSGLPKTMTSQIGDEVTLPGLPACTIRFSGPISGEQPHEGGDALIGFMVPGTYTISADPFPVQAFTVTLTVSE